MTAEIKKIEEILGSGFSIDNYVALIEEIFSSAEIVAPYKKQQEFSNFSSHIVGYSHVANYETPEDEKLIIVAVELQKNSYVENARSTQRSYAKKIIESSNSDAAVVAFYTEGDPKWRLSFVRLDYEMKFENGKLQAVENITPAKRYSFLVGADEPSHTAIDRLHLFITDKNAQPTLDDLEEAFSVERVTKEFFDLYCEKYHQLREHLLTNEDFLAESEKCGFSVEQFAKKLMGQIVFLYFLQKKGWLGVGAWPNRLTEKEYKNVFYTKGAQGRLIKEYLPQVYVQQGEEFVFQPAALYAIPNDAEELIANNIPQSKAKNWGEGSKHFLRTLFDFFLRQGGNFHNDYLEPLFYDALNKNRGPMGYSSLLHCRIPFLSGGLFEPIKGYDWEISNFCIPDEIFSNRIDNDPRTGDGILDIFDRYNFTMSEDEPMEREVAIDPEMLGKVFENLLDVTDRKSKGAFYTPREIVHYMCQESLINYLTTATGLDEQDVRDFILYGDFMKDEDTVKEKRLGNGAMYISEEIFKIDEEGNVVVNRLNDIDNALADIRIADPAVGSGAFPVGMLNEIVRARQNLTEYLAVEERTKATSEKHAGFLVRELRQGRSAYDLKWYAIKNSIFAVDIEPSAVDIAQLRLWLSLVIDDETNPEATNILEGHRNPLPLPNLECNILCGNSLVDEFEGYPLLGINAEIGTEDEGDQYSWAQSEFDAVIPKILETQDAIFVCDDPIKKLQLLEELSALKDSAIETQLTYMEPDVRERYEESKTLVSKPYILWQLEFAKVFRDKGGFDVVIGNPPYVGESGHKDMFRIIAATGFGKKYYHGKMDYFYFFFHKGLDLLHEDGVCSLITTNYFLAASGAKTLREDFRKRANIYKLVNFNELKIFQSAIGQHNMVTFLKKENDQGNVECCITNQKGIANPGILQSIVLGHDGSTKYFSVYAGDLYDSNGNIAFHEKNEILEKMKKTQNYKFDKKSIGGGIDILQESVVDRHLEIDDTLIVGSGIFAVESEEIESLGFSEKEKEILKPYYTSEQIKKYAVIGDNHKWVLYTNKKVCEEIEDYPNVKRHLDKYSKVITSDNKPYGLHRPRIENQFVGKKILSLRMTREPCFTYADLDTYVTRAYLTIKCPEVDEKYIVGLLNSKLFYYWLFHMGKRKGKQLQIDQAQICDLPIVIIEETIQRQIIRVVEKIIELAKKEEDYTELQKELDDTVYKIYSLTKNEITIIDEFIAEQRAL